MKKKSKRKNKELQAENTSTKFNLNDHWDFLLVGIILIAAFLLRWSKVTKVDGMIPGYLMIAKWIRAGLGFKGPDGLPHVVFPPLYPYLISFASHIISDTIIASKIVNVILGSLTIIPLFKMIQDIFNKVTGYIVIIIFTTNSFLVSFSANSHTEASYTFFLIFGIYLAYLMIKKSNSIYALFAGLFFALSYLTKPEGFANLLIIAGFAIGYTVFSKKKIKLQIGNVGLMVAIFFLVALPYILFLHQHTGKWTLSNKSGYVLAAGRASAGAGSWEEEYWGLNEEGTERKAIDHEMRLTEYLLKNPQETYNRVLNGLKEEYLVLNDALYLNKGVLILALMGLIGMIYKKGERFYGLLFLSLFAPMILSTISAIVPRYIYAYSVFMILFIAFGCVFIAGRISALFIRQNSGQTESGAPQNPPFLIALSLITLIVIIFPLKKSLKPPTPMREDPVLLQSAGWIKKNLPQRSSIMSRRLKISYYSDSFWSCLPYGPYKKIITYARAHNVNYLFLRPLEWRKRPQLRFLFNPDSGIPEELQLIQVLPVGSKKIKYFLYQIV